MNGRTVSRCIISAAALAVVAASLGAGCSFHTPDGTSVPASSSGDTSSSSGTSGTSSTSGGTSCTRQTSAFLQYYKCNQAISLGDQGSEAACRTACLAQSSAKGCWYLDGSGGYARDCRICTDGPPVRDNFSNDWGAAITCVSSNGSSSGTSGTTSSSGTSGTTSSSGTSSQCYLGTTLTAEAPPATCPLQCNQTDPMGQVNTVYCAQQNLQCCCIGGGLSWRCVGCPLGTACGSGVNAGKCCP